MAGTLLKCRVLKSFVSDRLAPAAGQIIEAPPEALEDWLQAGLVEVIKETAPPAGKKAAGEVETAALSGAPETTVAARGHKK